MWSPRIPVMQGPHCLDFRYKLRNADLVVSVMNSTDNQAVLTVEDDGQALVWHRAWANVDSNVLGPAVLAFGVTAKPEAVDKVALDDIRLLAGDCKSQG